MIMDSDREVLQIVQQCNIIIRLSETVTIDIDIEVLAINVESKIELGTISKNNLLTLYAEKMLMHRSQMLQQTVYSTVQYDNLQHCKSNDQVKLIDL